MTRLIADRDGEARIFRNIKDMPGRIFFRFRSTLKNHFGLSLDDFHALGLFRSKIIAAGQDHPDCLTRSSRENNGVGNDAALKIDIGLGVNGDIGEFHTLPHRHPRRDLQVQSILICGES